MQHRKNMILYNVLNQETVFEEYFCNLLSINEFRKLFLEFIAEKNQILSKEMIEYKHFNTEVILDENCGRADLFLKLENKEFIFEIKNKEFTSLTPNQPMGYLNYLKKIHVENVDFNKHLFFLIPKNYKHKGEIYSRWTNDKISNSNIDIQIFDWESFLNYIKIKNYLLVQNNLYIKIFYDFCLHWFEMEPIIFTEEEQKLILLRGNSMNMYEKNLVPKLMRKLEELVMQIGKKANLKPAISEVGFYYDLKNKDLHVSVGIDYSLWENGKPPINIIIQNHQKDYQEFEQPEVDDLELEKFYYEETSISAKQFAYIVKLDAEIGSKNYEDYIQKTIEKILKTLF